VSITFDGLTDPWILLRANSFCCYIITHHLGLTLLDELFHRSVGRVADPELAWVEIAQGTETTEEAQ